MFAEKYISLEMVEMNCKESKQGSIDIQLVEKEYHRLPFPRLLTRN